jgi:hypothetical protein
VSARIWVLAAICAALAIALFVGGRDDAAPTGEAFALPADFDRITVERPGAPAVIVDRRAAAVIAPAPAPADADVLRAIDEAFAAPVAMDQDAPLPPEERGRYGLGGEGVVVTLGHGNEPLARFRLGKVVAGQRTFILVLDRPDRVYRARANLVRLFDRPADAWRERRLFRVGADDLARLESTRSGELRWRAVRQRGQTWRFEVPAGAEAGDAEIGGLAHALTTLSAEAFAPPGTPFTPLLRLDAETFDGAKLGVEVAPQPDGRVLARRAGDSALVRLPAHQAAFLDQGAEVLRDRRLFAFGARDVRGVAVDGDVRLVRDEDQTWRLEAPVLVNPVAPDKVMPFLEGLAGLQTAGFPERVPEDAFANPAIRMEIRLIDDRVVTLTVGAEYLNGARYARTSERPDRTYVLGPGVVRGLRPGADAFRPDSP